MPIALTKPPCLQLGDTIGVVAPSMPLLSAWPDQYERGLSELRRLGFAIREGRTIGPIRWWGAGTPREAADDLNSMFADDGVKALIAHTGGFSGMAVLEHLDYDLIREHPKPLLGYSDITLLHLALFCRCGLVGFHADDVTFGLGGTWTELEGRHRGLLERHFVHMLTSTEAAGAWEPLRTWQVWRHGRARGQLIGGNLKRITALAATPYFPPLDDFEGAILFLEEIGRELWDVSIDLYILKHLGIFDRISGLLIGNLVWINESLEGIEYPTIREMFFDVLGEYAFPILTGLDFGHHIPNAIMPIGIEAAFETAQPSLSFLEAPVA